MQVRMLCTDCGVTAHADTLLEGSDRMEATAWVLGAALGWLYCARRHWLRSKVCSHCGSRALVREARAVSVAWGLGAAQPRLIVSGPQVVWPRGLGSPRERLRAGAPAALLALLVAGAALLGASVGVPLRLLAASGIVWTAFALAWAAVAVLRRTRTSPCADGCRAWDAQGRRLRIEVL